MVAADPRVANTKVEGDFILQELLALMTPGISNDRVLNGPTNDVWINPWIAYLTSRGVRYELNSRVVSLQAGASPVRSLSASQGR